MLLSGVVRTVLSFYGTSCRSVNGRLAAQWSVRAKDPTSHQLKLFGGNLRRERIARKVTQEKLAELADLNIRTLQKIEAGQTNILVTTAMRLRKALECPWDSLLGQ
jgi:DNA-binding XRE family transcriptional regulator